MHLFIIALPDLNPDIFQVRMTKKIVNLFYHILVNKIGSAGINNHGGIFRHFFQFFLNNGFVKKRNIFPEPDQEVIVVVHNKNRRPEITSYHKEQANQDTDKNANQQTQLQNYTMRSPPQTQLQSMNQFSKNTKNQQQ